jgi:hypothetical protein
MYVKNPAADLAGQGWPPSSLRNLYTVCSWLGSQKLQLTYQRIVCALRTARFYRSHAGERLDNFIVVAVQEPCTWFDPRTDRSLIGSVRDGPII